jgi:hypothetical protein
MPFERERPIFSQYQPLTASALAALWDIAAAERQARYADLSDGVVSGCGLYEENGYLGVESGIVKFGGGLYISPERQSLPYRATETWSVLKIVFQPERQERDFIRGAGELALDDNIEILPNEMELGRFKLKEGFRLRMAHESFQDMGTAYDTLCLIHVPMAATGGPTLSPLVTQAFAREAYPFLLKPAAVERAGRDPLADIVFCGVCLTSNTLRREYIQLYVCGRLGWDYRELDNGELYRRLGEILESIKTGRPLPGGGPAGRKTLRLM